MVVMKVSMGFTLDAWLEIFLQLIGNQLYMY